MNESDVLPLETPNIVWDEVGLGRRRFLKWGFFSVAGAMTMAVSGIFTRFFVGHSLQAPDTQWIDLGPIADLPTGRVHKVNYVYQTTDAWERVQRQGMLYAYSDDGETYTALDATCTHLGCLVRWQEQEASFSCPCHEGIFTRDGVVVSGAPTKPLRRFSTKIENGSLKVQV